MLYLSPARWAVSLRAVVVVSLSAGCVSQGPSLQPSPSAMVVQGVASEGMLFMVRVLDHSGRLASAEVVAAEETAVPLTLPDMDGLARVPGSQTAMFVAWVSRPCEDRPTLTIEGADAMRVLLERGPEREGACPDYAHYFAVRLTFDAAIDVDGVDFAVADD